MLRSSKDIEGCAIGATDGEIGNVKDLYFDDAAWVVRYLVVATGSWLMNRQVLVSPVAIGHAHWVKKVLSAAITQEQVRNSPNIDTAKPVSRQHELQFLQYYRYPPYWGGVGLWGPGSLPSMLPGAAAYERSAKQYTQAPAGHERAEGQEQADGDPHLRSCNAIIKYDIHAQDGDIGHLRGLLIDDETWAIRYLIADTGNWWLGHPILIAPQWIERVSWPESKVFVDLTRQAIKEAPPYDPATLLDQAGERALFDYYGRSADWAEREKHIP